MTSIERWHFYNIVGMGIIFFASSFSTAFAQGQKKNTETSVSVETIEKIQKAIEYVKRYHPDIKESDLAEDAIRSILKRVDKNSRYISTRDSLYNKNVERTGEFSGIGLEFGGIIMEANGARVRYIVKGSPAEKSEIVVGALITRIDGQSLRKKTLYETIRLMHGSSGTFTILTFTTPKDPNITRMVRLQREVVKIPSVTGRMIDKANGIGYLSISAIYTGTLEEIKHHIEWLLQQSHVPLEALVLDLRNNHGGDFQSAINIAQLFLKKGAPIIRTQRTDGNKREDFFFSKNSDYLPNTKLIVLVNRQTASSAEIITGALQVNDRALVVGEKTYGKGTAQSYLPLLPDSPNSPEVLITTTYFFLPNGCSINRRGIIPYVTVITMGKRGNTGYLGKQNTNNSETQKDSCAASNIPFSREFIQKNASLYRLAMDIYTQQPLVPR